MKFNKIIIIIISLLFALLIFFIVNICTRRKNIENLKQQLNKVNKIQLNNQLSLSKPLNYLYMEEADFNILSIPERWKYRSECLNHFNDFKQDYAEKSFIYPLPKRQNNGLIFINLASYRDPECPKTVMSLIHNSSNWKNLRIYVCEQNAPEDPTCSKLIDSKFKDIIKILNIDFSKARGPTWARFLIQQQYSGEEYYLQIDSHTLFEKNWDSKLIHSLNYLQYKNGTHKNCLTQYLPDYKIGTFNTEPKLRANLKVSRICALDGFTRINAVHTDPQKTYKEPFESNGWSGCFSFSKGDICIDAPIDCYTPDVFFGEEMDIALRLFTRGWKFYAPNYPIAYTNFNRNYRDTFWQKKGLGYNKNITLCSRLRIHYRLGTLPQYLKEKIEKDYSELLVDTNKFILGNEKTLKDYEKLIGYSFDTEN